jgi:hypothetical protein
MTIKDDPEALLNFCTAIEDHVVCLFNASMGNQKEFERALGFYFDTIREKIRIQFPVAPPKVDEMN